MTTSVRQIRHLSIPVADGVHLDAQLWLPDGPGPFPAVFDYYPYRKDDLTASLMRVQRALAQRGFAALRIDVRGTGSSGGTAHDEYTLQEQLDGVAAIAWLAAQPWCDGNVGMFGGSYGGFNALQIAMHRPPALKAICPMYFTDDRYRDDCHYRGGTMQMLYDIGTYGLDMVVENALPPQPEATGAAWADVWQQHLAGEPWLLRWIEHPTRDGYWRHGSLCEDYAAIECACLLIGGWRDGYANCTLRTFAQLRGPRRALIGPWLHVIPDIGTPGPRVDHIHEMARFFDHWLRGVDTGMMREPPITLYLQHADPPAAQRPTTSGRWVTLEDWPLPQGGERRLYLGDGDLRDAPPAAEGRAGYRYHPFVGTSFGMFSAGSPLVLPLDQRGEEAYSACWTSAPFAEALDIIGQPTVRLTVAVGAPVAMLVVRCCDVAPDGTSALITKGVLNLTHRDSDETPTPVPVDTDLAVTLLLDATAWHVAPGHALRLSVSGADFPNSWPSPLAYDGTVITGGVAASQLVLPLAPGLPDAPAFAAPRVEPLLVSHGPPPVWQIIRDPIADTTAVHIRVAGETRLDMLHSIERISDATALVSHGDPAQATVRAVNSLVLRWPLRTITARARGQISSDARAFHLTIELVVDQDGITTLQRAWSRSMPRGLQ